MVCGKKVVWGRDGRPFMSDGLETGALFGAWIGMKHYHCENNFDKNETLSKTGA
jgi:hypothetical protein